MNWCSIQLFSISFSPIHNSVNINTYLEIILFIYFFENKHKICQIVLKLPYFMVGTKLWISNFITIFYVFRSFCALSFWCYPDWKGFFFNLLCGYDSFSDCIVYEKRVKITYLYALCVCLELSYMYSWIRLGTYIIFCTQSRNYRCVLEACGSGLAYVLTSTFLETLCKSSITF